MSVLEKFGVEYSSTLSLRTTVTFGGGAFQSLYLVEGRLFHCVDGFLRVFLLLDEYGHCLFQSGLSLLLYRSSLAVDWTRVCTLEFRVEAL